MLSCMSTNNIDPSKTYTVPEVAEMIGVTGRTVRRYVRRGLFGQIERNAPMPLSAYRIQGAAISAFLEQRKQ